MSDPRSTAWQTDDRLEAALRELSAFVAVPATIDPRVPGAPDPARRARLQIEQGRRRPSRSWIPPIHLPRLRRSFALALIAVVVVAAAAGAIGLGLPGIRIIPAPGGSPTASATTPSPSASLRPSVAPTTGQTPSGPTPSGPPGSDLGLGSPVVVSEIASSVDFPVVLPPGGDPGPPTTAWLLEGRLSLVWRAGPTLPATEAPGVGLILEEFRGSVDAGYFEKVLDQGTTITTVEVNGRGAYWISGAPHEFVYVNPNGEPVWDSHRSVGDTLIWTNGELTYRLESALGRDATIALAESLR